MEKTIKKKKVSIIIIVLTIITIIVIGTYALVQWTSTENTELTLRIGQTSGLICSKENDISVSNIGPVFDYEQDGEITEFTVLNLTGTSTNMSATLKVNTITDNLKRSDFKYVVMYSVDEVNYFKLSEGNFSNVNNLDKVELFANQEISGNTYYKVIFYIDGNMENSIDMQNGSLAGVIYFCGDIPEEERSQILTLESTETENLTTSFTVDDATIEKISSIEVTSSGGGTAEATIEGNVITVTATGATPDVTTVDESCEKTPSTTTATNNRTCTSYSCDYSWHELYDDWCYYDDSYTINGSYTNIYLCYYGSWAYHSTTDGTYTECDSGYEEDLYCDESGAPSGSCSPEGATQNLDVSCTKTCSYSDSYAATCDSYQDNYSCSSSDYNLVSSTCYKCDTDFTFNSSTLKCDGTCSATVSTWTYEVKINYIVVF